MLEKNYKDENVMMCDSCGHLFVASGLQRNGLITSKFICRRCEQFDVVKKTMHENFQRGRD